MGVEAQQARAHFERGNWVAAFESWSIGDPTKLTASDLDRFATTAELLGHYESAVGALQGAFARSRDAGDLKAAVRCAFRLAMSTGAHGEDALSAGWVSRAEGLVAEIGQDCAEAGWVAFLQMFRALGTGAFDQAAACVDRAMAAGRRHGDPDLLTTAICARGRLWLYTGGVTEGLTLLDEAMVRVIAGETSPVVAGHVYCTAIEGCQEIHDFGRMAEWTSALERWCAAQPGLLEFTGQSAVHRGQLMRLRGDWARALVEFEEASRRYGRMGTPGAVGLAAREAGDVLRMLGDYDAADAAYQRAAEHGSEPQPGLALLWLALGRQAAAVAAVGRLLAETGGPVQRLRVLPAAVDVLLAVGDVDRARLVGTELDALGARFRCVWLEAAVAQASGAVELAAGDAAGAMPYLRKAQHLFAHTDDPYGRARAGVLAGRAMAALGDAASSRRELEAARATFRRLGARPAAREVDELLARATLPAGLTPRESEVLRLVATGRSNAQIAAELVLSDKTVARHLSNIFIKLEVKSRTAAAAFAFEHDLA